MKNMKEKMGDLLSGEKFSSSVLTAAVIAVILVANTVLYTLFSYFGWHISATATEDFSISDNMHDIMARTASVGEKVTVLFCYPEKNVSEHGTGGYVYRTAKQFEAKYPDAIELKYVNIITNTTDGGDYLDVSKYATDSDGNVMPITKTSVIFIYGDNHRVVTDTSTDAGYADFFVLDYSGTDPYPVAYNGEEVMAANICWVLEDEHKTAYFTSGHGEVIDPAFANLISSAGYKIGVVDLKTSEVPENADLLIISNPRTDFEASAEGSGARGESDSDRIKHYLERGGNLYVSLNSLANELRVLEGILGDYGISLSYAENEDGDRALNIVRDSADTIALSGYTIVAGYAENEDGRWLSDNVAKYSGGRVIISDVAALELSGEATPLLVSSGTSQLYAHGVATDTAGGYTVAASAEITGEDGRVGRLFVVPSTYLATTASLITNGYANKDFVYSLLERFYGCSQLPYGAKIISFRTPILEGLTLKTANIYTAIIMTIPVALAVVCAVVLIRRKNR